MLTKIIHVTTSKGHKMIFSIRQKSSPTTEVGMIFRTRSEMSDIPYNGTY